MKNTFNRFLCFVVIFGIFAFCGTFTSCENLFGGKTPINYEKAYITITTNLSTNARTVLPSNSFTKDTTGLTWTLTGIPSGGTEQQLKKWSDITGATEAATTTAYNNMISDTSITLNAGTWTFTLTASNESGELLLEATIEQKINGGENTLDFDMKEAVGEGAASGQIEFTLTFPGNVIKNVNATLTKRGETNSLVAQTFTADQTGPTETFLSEVKFSYPGNNNEVLSAGNYILKLELQQQTGLDPINTYTCLIHVAPGLCSKGEAELDTLARLYVVTFEDGIEFEESIVSLSYNAYTTFALPTIKEEEGYEYQWYKTVYNIYSNSYSQESIDDPSNVRITEDTTFCVKCYKIVDEKDIVRTAKGVSTGDSFSIGTAEGLGIFRDLVNGCNEDLKMVDNSGESVYYSLVSQSQLNAKLTSDIDLTQLEDADGYELSWVPINGYSGSFDGGGHTITVNNTYYSNEGVYYQGLFDTLDGATIKNLVVAGEETISESGLDYCGGIASEIKNQRGVDTTFENCVNKRNITVTTGVKRIGGFAGYTSSNNSETTNFVNCINLGTIENNYNASEYYEPYVAGFTSGATSYRNCINAGNVTGATFAFDVTTIFGTVAGFDANASASFTDCINLGDISANSYTFSDEKFCSTEKVYGFSSIENETNKPSFTNCIDAGSAKQPFTGFDDNITVTYNTCYYNSDSYSSSSNAEGKTSDELCIQNTNFSNWSYDSSNSRYPLPDIEENFSNEIWQEVVAKAIPKVSNFEMLQERIASANGTADNPAVIVLNGTINIAETLKIETPIKIIASTSAGVTMSRGLNLIEEFFNNTSTLTLEGITLDGGSTGEISIQAEAPLIMSSGNLTLNNCTLQNNNNSNATETGTGIFLQINDTSSLCSFNDVSFGKNSSDEIPHIKIKNGTSEKFTFNLGGSLEGGVPAIDMPSTTCINITESLTILDGESIKITLEEYTIGNRIISANEGIDLDSEISNFSLTTTDESWFIDSAGYLVGGSVIAPEISENGEFEVSSFENLLWIALELKRGSFTSFDIKLTEDIVIESGKWQFYQLNVPDPSTIDGQGHSITIDENVSKFGNDAGGLFYKFNNSTVKNLVLRGSITANTSAGGYIGALCRSAYGSIFENVMSEVTITDNGSGFAGGLIGRLGTSVMYDPTKAMVKNCAVYADVSSTNGIAGGILGAIWENTRCCTIQNSVYMGEIKGTTVGAIVGKNENNDVAESVLNNIWYCVTNNSSIPLIGTKADTTEEVITAVESKSADQIATAEAATLLNTNSGGTSNVVWEYVKEEAAYPTLKIVN
ncbi:MAG: hypothetical protein IJA53_10695 [Spirochaetaceae bacterium]|nr:hypothetical protein [Spirochaetaceae bacterium]